MKKPILLTLLLSLVLAIGLGVGAVEQRTRLLAESAQATISRHFSFAPLLHFRNEAELNKALVTALEIMPKEVWLRAIHVDGEVLTTAHLAKTNDTSWAGITSISRTSANRSEVLTTIEWPTNKASGKYNSAGALAALPFMNAQFLISIPVYSSVDPLRTDITRLAYQQALIPVTGQPPTFIAGYIEQGISLREIVTPMMPILGFILAISFMVGLTVMFTFRVFIRRVDLEAAELPVFVNLTDEQDLSQKIEPSLQQNLNLQEITTAFNRLISDQHELLARSTLDEFNVNESRTQGVNAAYFDPVTQLPCRQLLLEQMTVLMDIAARERRYVGLVLLEVGSIEDILKTHGREFSDDVLREITSRILNSVRKCDIVSRGYDVDGAAILDADQFCVVLHGINDTQEALARAEGLLDLVRAPVKASLKLQVVASVAAAPLHGETPESLLSAVKVALVEARESNASSGVMFSEKKHTKGTYR
jgi:diguanylate cyclase (GGDEF)-like protein